VSDNRVLKSILKTKEEEVRWTAFYDEELGLVTFSTEYY
jgi:hypothetical protein